MNDVAAQQCRHRQALSRSVTASDSMRMATDDELDTAILTALAELGGGPIPWSEVRAQLPCTRYWRPIEALVRLHQSGRVHAVRIGGATIVASGITHRRPRMPRATNTARLPAAAEA